MKTLLKLSVFATMLILIAISCQKDLSFENDVNKEFNTAFVKKWYNNSFIKSAEFTTHNQKENGKKQPDWKNGKYRKVGNMEIIDFPLLKEKKTISVRSDNSLTSADKKRIAKASLKRISFIKTANNEIVVRELDYVPEWEYLKAKNFDISDVELGNPNNTFTGRIITKKWSGEVLSVRLLTEGKITGRLISKQKASAITKSKSLKTPGNNLWECGPVEYCDETEMCEMEWVCTGDYCAYQFVVPNNCYWVEDCWTEEECEWVEEEPVCDYGLSESCECQLYNIGCSGGGNSPQGSTADDANYSISDTDPDIAWWDDNTTTFPPQTLPSWANINANYPKTVVNGIDCDMPAPDVYSLVGGPILSLFNSNPVAYGNACALRVSRALNYSGVVIPNIPGHTFLGGDNKYYFLSSAKLYNFLKKTFGITGPNVIELNQSQGGSNPIQNYSSLLSGNKGVYLMQVNYPSQFGALGHASIFNGSTCPKTHNCQERGEYFDAEGGVHKITLWILQ